MALLIRRGFLASALILLAGGRLRARPAATPPVPPGAPADCPVRYDPLLRGYRRPDDPAPQPGYYDTADPVITWRINRPYRDQPRVGEIERLPWQQAFDALKARSREYLATGGHGHSIFEPESGLRITIEEYAGVLRSHGVMVRS